MNEPSLNQIFRRAIEISDISFAELQKKTGISQTELLKYATDEQLSIPVVVIAKVAKATESYALSYLVVTHEIARAEMWKNIKRLIKERGITQKRFLEDICQSLDPIYLNGKKGESLQTVADYFGVTVSELLGKEPITR